VSIESLNADQNCLILGAGHAGSQLAIQLRKEGWPGKIVLIGDEPHVPYHRPPLSKAVLSGEKTLDNVLLRPRAIYDTNRVELRLGEQAVAVMREEKMLKLASGELLTYDRLAICAGARVIRLPLGEHLKGVFYLRNAADVSAIQTMLDAGKRAVIIGGGYVGLEAAAVLNRLGLVVTVLERSDRVLQRVTSAPVSDFFTRLHQRHGVTVVSGAEVTAISGAEQVESVQCADGSRFAADVVIIGIGVVPETALAEEAGLRIDNGIAVDQSGQTSDPFIYAAGDCTSHPSNLYQRRIRLESVQNANDQARIAAAGICGKPATYDCVPWFWSDQYDIKLQSAGLSWGWDTLILRGDPENMTGKGFSVLYGKDGLLIAADCINRASDFMVCRNLVQKKALLEPSYADETIDLALL
jgi:3-phenylpropionate/trans-cinnamate dioxygenase ferredoxin reductase component